MGAGSGLKGSGLDLLRIAIWSGAGLIITYVGISAVVRIEQLTDEVALLRNTVTPIERLTEEVAKFRTSLDKLEIIVGGLPPPDLVLRVKILEEKQAMHDLQHRDERK